MRSLLLAGMALLLLCAGCHKPELPTGRKIAVTTTYLESAARDILNDEQRMFRLAEPGTCPGHFDIRPSQAEVLRQCGALLRFDFQKPLDSVLDGQGTNGPFVVETVIHGGLCEPESYLAACRQIAAQFVKHGWIDQDGANARLQAVATQMSNLQQMAEHEIAQFGLEGRPVIASVHQKDFCAWLGLDVVAVFRADDNAGISEIENAIRAGKSIGVKLVIANQPEGRREANMLASQLNAKVVVFENFPALEHGRVSFDDMIKENIEALAAAVQ